MQKQPLWDKYEVALLIQAYLSMQIGNDDYERISNTLSLQLRAYAISRGISIDDTFRNTTGIKMKLKNIEYLYTNGESGLSACSKMDREIVDLQKNNSKEFSKLLELAKEKIITRHNYQNNYYTAVNDFGPFQKYLTIFNENGIHTVSDVICAYYSSFIYDENKKNNKLLSEAVSKFYNKFDSVPYSKLLDLDDLSDECNNLDSIDFSVRTNNCLHRCKAETVNDILQMSHKDISSIRSCGAKSVAEIENYLIKTCMSPSENNRKHAKREITKGLFENKQLLFSGDYEKLYSILDGETNRNLISLYEDAYNSLGKDIVELLATDTDETLRLYQTVCTLAKKFYKLAKLSNMVFNALPVSFQKKNAYAFIEMYSSSDSVQNALKAMYADSMSTLGSVANKEVQDADLLENFINWCSMDVYEEICGFINKSLSKDRTLYVITERSKGKSLQDIGDELNLSRERVRQIEAKVVDSFANWNKTKRILCHICAERDNDIVLTVDEINEYLRNYSKLVIYLLKSIECESYYYDKNTDVFIVGDESLALKGAKFIEQLPKSFNESSLNSYILEGQKLGITEEFLLKGIAAEYQHTNKIYHRSRLSLSDIYRDIVKKYYPNGFHIYDDSELDAFRKKIASEYGDVSLPQNNRAVSARLADVCVLCGRGTYKTKQDQYISDQLENDIRTYINESSDEIFPINMLFSLFEEKLLEFGINNKYYLQGVLHEIMGEEYSFRRDYLLKAGVETSFYTDIVEYIKASDYPVSRKEIRNRYPGVTEIVFTLATSDRKILNFFGKYLHVSKLKLANKEKEYIRNLANAYIKKDGYVHAIKLYEFIQIERPSMLTASGIYNQYSLFSVMEYLFEDYFEFQRPYIGEKGVRIERPLEQLQELIVSSDQLLISEITGFIRDSLMQVQSILELIDSFNTTHLLQDKNTIVSIESTGITEDIADEIEKLILEEIDGTMAINQLMCIYKFPSIKIKWDEWLIYSVIKKWSHKLDVASSDLQFRHSIPLISKNGEMDENSVNVFSVSTPLGEVDDLDNIDDLISDLLEEEYEGIF